MGNTQVHLLKSWRTNSLITVILGISLMTIGGTASISTILSYQEKVSSRWTISLMLRQRKNQADSSRGRAEDN